jgi:hypothetical protein
MYCSKCDCEYSGWKGKCPDCKTPLVERLGTDAQTFRAPEPAPPPTVPPTRHPRLSGELYATDVGHHKTYFVPLLLGWAFGWVKRMRGTIDGRDVNLRTTEVRMEKKWLLPGMGFGYAWAQRMEGNIGEERVTLETISVGRDRKWYLAPLKLGWGFAWAKEMVGRSASGSEIVLTVTSVAREKGWTFPGFGWGYAWEEKATLTISD